MGTGPVPQKYKDQRAKKFLQVFTREGTISKSCLKSGLRRGMFKRMLKEDEYFQEMFELAKDAYAEKLEREADRRGVKGVKDPVFYEGEICGHRKKYSDTLLMFRLKGLKPDVYGEKKTVEHNVSGQVNIYMPDNDRPLIDITPDQE